MGHDRAALGLTASNLCSFTMPSETMVNTDRKGDTDVGVNRWFIGVGCRANVTVASDRLARMRYVSVCFVQVDAIGKKFTKRFCWTGRSFSFASF